MWNWLISVKDLDAYCVILLLFHIVNICHKKRREKKKNKIKNLKYSDIVAHYLFTKRKNETKFDKLYLNVF